MSWGNDWDEIFASKSQEKRLTAQVPEIAALKARLSRYETAMRRFQETATQWHSTAESWRLAAPENNDVGLMSSSHTLEGSAQQLDVILRAALSDQPAAEPAESKLEAKCERRVLEARIDEHAKTCGDCNETNLCDDMLELRRWLATLSDQPAEEPAGSKLEAIRRLVATLDPNPGLHSAALTDVGKENRKISEAILAILDARPRTPEPKGEI